MINNEIDFVRVKLVPDRKVYYDQPLRSPDAVADFLMDELMDCSQECMMVLNLDTKGMCISARVCSMGTVNMAVNDPREVFQTAILSEAKAVILAHNHPSGDLTPSQEDIDTTKRMVAAGKLLGIDVLDHVIVGRSLLSGFGAHYSMRRENPDIFQETISFEELVQRANPPLPEKAEVRSSGKEKGKSQEKVMEK